MEKEKTRIWISGTLHGITDCTVENILAGVYAMYLGIALPHGGIHAWTTVLTGKSNANYSSISMNKDVLKLSVYYSSAYYFPVSSDSK
jgi:hypothetical protein